MFEDCQPGCWSRLGKGCCGSCPLRCTCVSSSPEYDLDEGDLFDPRAEDYVSDEPDDPPPDVDSEPAEEV